MIGVSRVMPLSVSKRRCGANGEDARNGQTIRLEDIWEFKVIQI
jgi:hypothetical protein